MKNRQLIFALVLPLVCCVFLQKSIGQNPGAKWVVPPVMDVDKIEISAREDNAQFVVKKGYFSGVFDKSGKAILPTEYGSISLFYSGWIQATKERKKLLFNAKGENIGLPYDGFTPYNNGTAVVSKNNLFGLINQQGEEIVPVQFEQFKKVEKTYLFTKGDTEKRFDAPPDFVSKTDARVEAAKARSVVAGHIVIQGGKNQIGLLNLKGDTVVPPLYRFGAIHASGYLVASFDGKTWGVIDTRHKTLYPFSAERIGEWTNSGLLPIRSEKQWSLLRFPSGEVVFPPGEYEHIEVYDPGKDIFLVVKNKLQGLVDSKGKVILPLAYTYISKYNTITTELANAEKKRGFFHRPSGYLQEPIYNGIKNLNDSLVIVYNDSLQHALINAKTGRVLIPFSDFWIDRMGEYFDSHKKYNFNLPQTFSGHLHGLYDRKGKLVFPHDSVEIHVVLADNTFWISPHFIDSAPLCEQRTPDGKVLRSLPKVGADLRQRGFLLTYIMNSNGQRTAKQYCYYDALGKEQYYETIDNLKENLRRVKRGDLWGCIDDDGKVVIQPVFDAIEPSVDGYIQAKYQGKWGVLQNPRFDYFLEIEKTIKK